MNTTGRVGKGKRVHNLANGSSICGSSFRKGLGANLPTHATGETVDCRHCLRIAGETVPAAPVTAPAAPAPARCTNSGVTHPHRISSKCSDCDAFGKVTGGRLRAHAPR